MVSLPLLGRGVMTNQDVASMIVRANRVTGD